MVLTATGNQMAHALANAVKTKRHLTIASRLSARTFSLLPTVDSHIRNTVATHQPWLEDVTMPEPVQSPPSTMARVCVNCPVCRQARRRQRGLAFWLVKKVEGKLCWFGRAYERRFGRKPHEPIQPEQSVY
jgi:hypothetical protein